MANISFGERLRRARVRNAMTQGDLGEKIGVAQATISNWEIGKIVPSKEQKAELKRVLGGFSPEPSLNRTEPVASVGPTPLSGWLTKTRLEKNLSVPELAVAAGVSAQAVYNIESGRILNPRQETIRRLERALGKDIPKEAKEEIREEAKIEDKSLREKVETLLIRFLKSNAVINKQSVERE